MFSHPQYSRLKVFGVCILAGVAVSLFSACGVFEDTIPELEQETAIEIPQRDPDIKDAVQEAGFTEMFSYVRQMKVEVTLFLESSELDYLRNDITSELQDFIFENRDPATLLYPLKLQERLIFVILVDDDYIATSTHFLETVLAGPSSFQHRGFLPSFTMNHERVLITLTLLPNPFFDDEVEPEVLFSGTWQEINDLDDAMINNFFPQLVVLIKRPADRTIAQPTERLRYFEAGISNFLGENVVYLKNQNGTISAEYGSLHEYQFKTRSVWGEVDLEAGMFIFRGNIGWDNFGSPAFVIGTNGQPIFLGMVVSFVPTDYHILEMTQEGTGIALDMRHIFANLRGTRNPE